MKKFIQMIALLAILIAPASALSVNVYAADARTDASHNGCGNNELAKGIAEGATSTTERGVVDCSDTDENADGTIKTIAKAIVNILTLIVGVASIIMIIVGGFKYITSGGDSNRVGSAKNTIIYAVIGLIIVAVAQVIVRFVLSQTTNAVK